MPSYELSLLLRILPKQELVSTLKRTAEMILGQGGILRQFTSVGTKPLPFKMKAHNAIHREGQYFLLSMIIKISSKTVVKLHCT